MPEQQDARGDIIWTCTASCYDAQFGAQVGAYWEGFVANSELQLVTNAGEDNELWKSVMDAYADADAPRDTFSQAGFLAAKMFTDAVLELDPADISRETVSEAMLGITNYESDLLCAPWYFGEADEHNANHSTRTAGASRSWTLSRAAAGSFSGRSSPAFIRRARSHSTSPCSMNWMKAPPFSR